MRETAYTTWGRNALAAGLICHVSALIAAMVPVAGSNNFFNISYPFYWTIFILGVYTELKSRRYSPLGNWRFYILSSAAVFPIIGPLIAFFMLYYLQGDRNSEPFKLWGMFTSVLRLRANLLVVFLIVIILVVLFVVTLRQHDSYFRKADMNRGLLLCKPINLTRNMGH